VPVATACNSEQSPHGRPVASPVASEHIVESSATSGNTPTLTLSEKPSLIIGSLQGPASHIFDGVVDAVRLSTGEIAVALSRQSEIRVYDAQGEFITSIGRYGQGPGEYAQLRRLFVLDGDTIVATDQSRKVTYLSPRGRVYRVFEDTVDFVGGLTDGSMVMARVWEVPIANPQAIDDSTQYFIRGAPGREVTIESARAGVRRTFIGGSPTFKNGVGYPVGAARGGTIAFAFGGESTIAVYNMRGDRALTLKLLRPVRLADESFRKQQLDAYYSIISAKSREKVEALGIDKFWVDTLPSFDAMMLDRTGRIWVRDYVPLKDPMRRWFIFGSDGKLVGSMVDKTGMSHVYDVGPDFVLGRYRDADEVEYVHLYNLSGPR
jgi:hypothetical protein